jgi:hypothetical protein
MARYKVLVDDNFHHQDEEERWTQGVYATRDEALSVCRGLVDQFLNAEYKPGMSAETLYGQYTSFGNDPFIMVLDGDGGGDDAAAFSAWDYAKTRCQALCGGAPTR